MTAALRQPGLPLSVERLQPAAWTAAGGGGADTLGALAYGTTLADVPAVRAAVLPPGGPMVDAWSSPGPHVEGVTGRVRWRHNGHWLFGTLDVVQAGEGEAVSRCTRDAYRDVFAVLRATGCPHLQRLWNYLPHINADSAGLERYRWFNSGRQAAFLEARQAAFEGAPAACALGTREGPLGVRFLAASRPAVPIENPRQVPAWRYPRDYGPTSPTFSRAALADAGDGRVALFLSGTASVVGHASVHAGDVQAQAREALRNVDAVLEAAERRCSGARFDASALECVVYVRHAADAPAVHDALAGVLGADAPALRRAVLLEADICRADLLVEIEAHAIVAGEVAA